MKSSTDPGKLEAFRHISLFKPAFDFIFEDNQFYFHFGIDVSFFICGPKTPESITNDISLTCFCLSAKNILPKLQQYVLPLKQLCFLLLLILDTLLLCPKRIFYRLRFSSFCLGILEHQLLHLGLSPTILWWFLTSVDLLKILVHLGIIRPFNGMGVTHFFQIYVVVPFFEFWI